MREVSFSDGATASLLLASVLPGRPVSLLCEAAETEAEEAELGRGAEPWRGGARVGAEPGRGRAGAGQGRSQGEGRGSGGEGGASSQFPLGPGRPRPVSLSASGDMEAGRGTVSDRAC